MRQVFFAQSLEFPLVTEIPTPLTESYDFARATARVKAARSQMDRFTDAVRAVLGADAPAAGASAT